MHTPVRKAVVAGQFYPASERDLRATIKSFLGRPRTARAVKSCLLPHAGYAYSGAVAARTLQRCVIPETALLLGPNHTGQGALFSVADRGSWQTPLGEVPIDEPLAAALLKRSRALRSDSLAQRNEHSLEVLVPLLQYLRPDIRIVPVTLFSQQAQELARLGEDIAEEVERHCGGVLIVASSDMTHYEPQERATAKDAEAIKALEALDPDALVSAVCDLKITMCGTAPALAMLSAARKLGAREGKLIEYTTSGSATGDYASVVGYAGMIFY